ncbi:hypothetical protein BSKO_07463 [Bryopsis sp. KO-2023]|nr:hypothetical protein BSKO_07463 [Bryopsis sp. KO-2023]
MGKLKDILDHPDEFMPMVRMYFEHRKATRLPSDRGLAFCYEILNSVSRSFSVVIQQLPSSLRDAVCVFYLVLRGLDTVEDDMGIPLEEKLPLLKSFHEKIYDRGFTLDYGTDHYKRLLNQFGTVSDVFLGLEDTFKDTIADICKRMGYGMAEFIEKEVVTVEDFDLYCHYVAGLVGVGLSKLFAGSGLENQEFQSLESLSNEMGLFLQKTNIIRDYLEDIEEEPAPRMFWPRDVWGLYGKELEDFKAPENREGAIKCLNHLITDALRHVPSCFEYMGKLKDPMIYRFCAIPQVMAVGTLALCYNNGKVFEGVVKMRRGETCVVFDRLQSFEELYKLFHHHVGIIGAKCQGIPTGKDPNIKNTLQIVEQIEDLCVDNLKRLDVKTDTLGKTPVENKPIEWWVRALVLFFTLGYVAYAFGVGDVRESLGVKPNAGNWMVDSIQRVFALLLLLVGGVWVGLLGKRV